MLCFNKLTGEHNAKNTLKTFCFVGVYIFNTTDQSKQGLPSNNEFMDRCKPMTSPMTLTVDLLTPNQLGSSVSHE